VPTSLAEPHAAVAAYLRNRVSRSVVFLLMLAQPLTRREMETHPLRLHALARLRGGRSAPAKDLRGVLRAGVDAGVLVPLGTRRENYYFLNSDLALVPAPLGSARDFAVRVDDRTALQEEAWPAAPPPGVRLLADGTRPVPHFASSFRCLAWLDWVTTPRKRRILEHVARHGPVTRPRVRSALGTWSDQLVVREALPFGVLVRDGETLRLPFADESVGTAWWEKPPTVGLSRTYEVLACVQDAKTYLEDAGRKSPMRLLGEMAADGRRVRPGSRERYLEVNYLQVADVATDAPQGPSPSLWIQREDFPRAILAMEADRMEGDVRADRRIPGDPAAFFQERLLELARSRIARYLKGAKGALAERRWGAHLEKGGLGREALLAIASAEMDHEVHRVEKEHFERFLRVLQGESLEPKRVDLEAEEP
jgi:hypothetical protein